MKHRLLKSLSLKWDPFSHELPLEAIHVTSDLEGFCWRLENQLSEGGFALVTGDPGTGKSVTLRVLDHRLRQHPDVAVRVLARPQSQIADFYRELGEAFGVPLKPHNRWAGFKSLRQAWLEHIDTTLSRPVVLIDEAQEMPPATLSELRLLSSTDFDSRSILTVVLAGDRRLTELFKSDELLPLGNRIRVRLTLEPRSPAELLERLEHSLAAAGNPDLVTPDVRRALAEHSAGNHRVLNATASELLASAVQRKAPEIDEALYLELFGPERRAKRRSRR